ncbi:diacylglycerol/lipid kinase family protein [Streptomyces sp. NPDC059010]|uniref:diacylglycerol/lipid kinase family protein n=1 Tax=Streptomyces sp. NPDC059010 TaxID=3346695 RepID=UPI0036A82B4E
MTGTPGTSGTTARQPTARCLVVANPTAGSADPDLIGRILSTTQVLTDSVRIHWTAGPGDATRVVTQAADSAADAPDVVLVIGGDGTVREAAEGIARAAHPGRRPALLIAPAGTGNSVHRALWGDLPWPEVLRTALGTRATVTRRLDIAWAGDRERAVLLGAATGFVAEVTARASQLTEVAGRERYHRAMGEVLPAYRPYPGRVTVDGTVLHKGATTMALVGGARHRVGTFKVLPRSELDDGLLDICVIDGDLGTAERDELALHIMAGTHLGRRGVHYAQGRQVLLERTDGLPLAFEHDGEPWPSARRSVELRVSPAAVPALAPAQP